MRLPQLDYDIMQLKEKKTKNKISDTDILV